MVNLISAGSRIVSIIFLRTFLRSFISEIFFFVSFLSCLIIISVVSIPTSDMIRCASMSSIRSSSMVVLPKKLKKLSVTDAFVPARVFFNREKKLIDLLSLSLILSFSVMIDLLYKNIL